MSFALTIAEERFDSSLAQIQRIYGLHLHELDYHDILGAEIAGFLDDENLSLPRVEIMFGLNSYSEEYFRGRQASGDLDSVIQAEATKLLQFLVLGSSNIVYGLREFMSTDLTPLCNTLFSAGADPNSDWPASMGGTLWTTILLFYARRFQDGGASPDVTIVEAFVKHGADLTAKVRYQGQDLTSYAFVHTVLEDHPESNNKLTKLLEMIKAKTDSQPAVQILVSPPSEQLPASQLPSAPVRVPGNDSVLLMNTTKSSKVRSVSSKRSTSPAASVVSQTCSEGGRRDTNLKGKLGFFRKYW